MTESGSNVEIEDVLASVRQRGRAEANDQQQSADAQGTGFGTADAAVQSAPDTRLILTPAYRIDDGGSDGAGAAGPDDSNSGPPRSDAASAAAPSDEEYTALLERRIAELEVALGAGSSGDEDDPRTVGRGPGPSQGPQSEAENMQQGARGSGDGLRVGANEFAFSDAGATVDADDLRDLVSEIVREELQGALGERITRNVRKMVRREIAHAISARDARDTD